MHRAIELGINYFDVSPFYGLTLAEERLGIALLGMRKDVILATKCGRYGMDSFDFSAARITQSIDESLARLRTDYVDLFLAHDIEFGSIEQIVDETLPALRAIQQAGKARYVGVTGYPLEILKAVAEREEVDAILSYCHYNLLITDLDADLGPFAKAQRIGLNQCVAFAHGTAVRIGWSRLASGAHERAPCRGQPLFARARAAD